MESAFNTWKTNRENSIQLIQRYTVEQMNTTPKGFSNNLIWNIGHIVVVQQMLWYKASHLPMLVSDDLVHRFKPVRPEMPVTAEECKSLLELMSGLMVQSIEDYRKGIFQKFNPLRTQTGFELNNFDDAVNFNNYHEGVHYGLLLNIRKFV
ncbi:MAG: DinB family protein [Bacteroidia bacterium]